MTLLQTRTDTQQGSRSGHDGPLMSWQSRSLLAGRCVLAGGCIALAIPPAGFWPLGIVGVALWDRLLANASWKQRARRSWLVAAAWLSPLLLWMWDLTAPGYVIAFGFLACYFAVACALVPPNAGRWIALPAAIVLAELARWSFPFEGVPLASLAMSLADTVLAQPARVGGALLVSGIVVVGGVALSAALERRWIAAGTAVTVIVLLAGLSLLAPQGESVDELDVALIQGGGEQRTRAAETDSREVFERHLHASENVDTPVDLVLWPENVVSVEGPLAENEEHREIGDLARDLDAPVVVGVTEGIDDERFRNASIVYLPDGSQGDRYDKVLRVPFGEYVPFRSLVEGFAADAGLPRRDAEPGDEPATLETPAGTMGVSVSWEVFFPSRGRDSARNDGRVLLNPTNGSSYWLTQVQTQQVASSQLRAIESGRWVLQAAPTGFSAVITFDGEVLERSDVSEQRLLHHTVEARTGDTLYTRFGDLPVTLAAIGAVVAGWLIARRSGAGPVAH